MQAKVGDWLVIKGHRVGQADREAQILAVEGEEGGPPYRVRWLDDEHISLVFPGPDAVIRRAEHKHGSTGADA